MRFAQNVLSEKSLSGRNAPKIAVPDGYGSNAQSDSSAFEKETRALESHARLRVQQDFDESVQTAFGEDEHLPSFPIKAKTPTSRNRARRQGKCSSTIIFRRPKLPGKTSSASGMLIREHI